MSIMGFFQIHLLIYLFYVEHKETPVGDLGLSTLG